MGDPRVSNDPPAEVRHAVADQVRLRMIRSVWAVTVGCMGVALIIGPLVGVEVTVVDAPEWVLMVWGLLVTTAASLALVGNRWGALVASALMSLWAIEIIVVLAGPDGALPGTVIGYTGLSLMGLVLSTRDVP